MALGHVSAPPPAASDADVLRRRYETADRILPARWKSLVFAGHVAPRSLGDGGRFWYASRRRDGVEFVAVDPVACTRAPLFHHESVATALSDARGVAVDPRRLP